MAASDTIARFAVENKRLRDEIDQLKAEIRRLSDENIRLEAQSNDLRQIVGTLNECLGSEQRARRFLLGRIEQLKIPPAPPATEPAPVPPGPIEDCNCDVTYNLTPTFRRQ